MRANSFLSPGLAVLLLLSWAGAGWADPFTPGNLVVVNINGSGISSANADSTGAPVSLLEMTTAGALVQTLNLPTSGAGGNQPFLLVAPGGVSNSGTNPNDSRAEGLLKLSTDGQSLSLAGYTTTNNPTANGNRVVASVNSLGQVNTTTTLPSNYFNGGIITSATTDNGQRFWVTGAGSSGAPLFSEVQLVNLGGSTPTSIAPSNSFNRVNGAEVYGGQLYVNGNRAAEGALWTWGSGAPTNSSGSVTELPGFASGPNRVTYDFTMLDNPNNPNSSNGLNTAYVVSPTDGIEKWTFDGTNWILAYSATDGGLGFRSITGEYDPATGDFDLFGATSAAIGNSLVAITDNGSGFAFDTIATAGAGQEFAGVAFTPTTVPEPSSLALCGMGCVSVAGYFWRRRKN